MNKIKLGITIGDINGIGLEVVLKTLADKRMNDLCTPVIYGSAKVVSYHKNLLGLDDFQFATQQDCSKLNMKKPNVINCWSEEVQIDLGKVTETGGKYAKISLAAAVNDLKSGHIDALVTAPINKEAMKLAGFEYPGHTEYLAQELGDGKNLMLMVNEGLRIGLVTNHVPVSEVAGKISKDAIAKKIKLMSETLQMDFGITKPNIAVLGLNPHAGDGGAIGKEEADIIRPAVVYAKKNGVMAFGPFPADGFFGSSAYVKFDGILAMYHDQGLVPFKTLSFGNGVNFTAGLDVVRTSPDHGTGLDIVGQNKANPASFRAAIYTAIDAVRSRREFLELKAGALKKKAKHHKEDSNATAQKIEEPDSKK